MFEKESKSEEPKTREEPSSINKSKTSNSNDYNEIIGAQIIVALVNKALIGLFDPETSVSLLDKKTVLELSIFCLFLSCSHSSFFGVSRM